MSDRDTPSAAEVLFAEMEDELLNGEQSDATPAAQDDDSAAPSPEAHADDADDSSSPPRDEKGRFTARESKGEEPDAAQPEATTETVPPTATADQVPPTQTPEAVAPEAPAPQPFAVTVDKQAVPIPGAALFEEGLYIPTDALPRVKEILSRGIHHEQTRRQLDQERRAVAEERAVWEQQKAQPTDETLVSRFLLEEMQELQAQLPPEIYGYLYDRVERRLDKAKLERYESGLAQTSQTFAAEDDARWKEGQIATWLGDLVAERRDTLGVLTPEDVAAIRDDLLPVADSLFVEHNGQKFIKDDVILRHLTTRATLVKQAREADQRAKAEAARVAKAAQEAARFNAGTQGKPNAPAVPKPTAAGKVTTTPSDGYDPDWRSKWDADDD